MIKNKDFGKPLNGFWVVYSDRENNVTYTSPNSSSTVYKVLNLMTKVTIAKIENGFALIYDEENSSVFPNISKSAKSLGWIDIDNLLLWNSCPVDEHRIYDKGLVVNNLDEVRANDDVDLSPNFKSSPMLNKNTLNEARSLEFYFIYKETDNAYLVGKQNIINGSLSEEGAILGWISKSKLTRWNKRVCLEPVYGENNVSKMKDGISPAIFLEKSDAIAFQKNGKMENVLAKPAVTKDRMSPYLFRYPILSTQNKGIHNVITVGNMESRSGGDLSEARRKLEELKKKQSKINVVFVVDGTSSMKLYFKPIVEALISSTDKIDKARFRFGAVVYRDYIDKDEAIESMALTNNVNSIISFLSDINAKSSPNDDLPEALYLGLETALSRKIGFEKDESNFIILVGDAGNHLNDKEGRTQSRVVDKLVDYSVNLIAFQANNGNDPTYTDFITQSSNMIKQTIKQAVGASVDLKTTKPQYRETVLKGRSDKTIIVGGIAFCDLGKSPSPQKLESFIGDKINDFNDQVKKWISDLERLTTGGGAQVWSPEITEWMRKKGFSDRQIKALQGEDLKVNGFTASEVESPDVKVFDYVMFLSKAELEELLDNLNKVYKPITPNRRKDFQDAMKSLALSYIGQNGDYDNYEVDEIMKSVLGGVPYLSNSLKGIKLKDILEPRRISDAQLDDYLSSFKQSITNLERIEANRMYYFESNGQRYYWIPIDEMP